MKSLFDPRRQFILMAVGLVVFTLIILSPIIYWYAFDNTPPVSNLEGEVVLKADDGSWVVIEWRGHRERSCPGTTRRWLVNGVRSQLPNQGLPYSASSKTGRELVWRERVDIPKHLEPPLLYFIELEYWCNPIHNISPLVLFPPWIRIE